jgi:hypothetical protein
MLTFWLLPAAEEAAETTVPAAALAVLFFRLQPYKLSPTQSPWATAEREPPQILAPGRSAGKTLLPLV